MEEKYLYVIIVLLIVGLIVLYFYDNNDRQKKISKIDDLENQLALCNVKPSPKMARSGNGQAPCYSLGEQCVSDPSQCLAACAAAFPGPGDRDARDACWGPCKAATCGYKCNTDPNNPNDCWVQCMTSN